MADALHFGIELDDLVSSPAHKAAQAVDDLGNELDKAKGKLAFFEQQLKLADKLGDVAGHDKYSAAVGQSTQHVYDLGNSLGEAKEAAGGAASGLEEMSAAAGPAAKVLAVVAAAAIAAGVALYEVGKFSIETALEVNAFNAQMEATFDALGKGPDAGARTVEMIDEVGKELPQSRQELAKWTREIEKMGVTDLSKVRSELIATASAQAILGEGGDAAYTKIARKVNDAIEGHHKLTITSKELTRTIGTNLADAIANKMGTSLEDLEKKLKAGTVDATKFGSAMEEVFIEKGAKGLDAMWLQTGAIVGKLKASFAELFSGIDTAPITDAMRGLLELFDQANPSGQVMKATLTDAFNGIVKAIGWAIEEGGNLFIELEILAIEAEIAIQPVWHAIQKIGEAAAFATAPLRALGASYDYFTKGPELPAAPGAGDTAAGGAQGALNPVNGLASALDAPSNDVGVAVGEGIVKGMVSMMGIVEAGGNDLGAAAVKGAKAGAGAHSPSVYAIEIGGNISQGLAMGMMANPAPAAAGRQIGGSAIGALAGGAIGGAPANSNGGGITISGLTIHITAPHGVTDATALSATSLVVALERLQLAGGR
jgi:hypothetical protein